MILIVDDEVDLTDYIKYLLKKHSIECLTANTVKEALEIIRNEPRINLIILDLIMPGIDGNYFIDEYKKVHGHIPIIIMSAEIHYLREDLHNIPKGFITKPFDSSILIGEIKKWVDNDSETRNT